MLDAGHTQMCSVTYDLSNSTSAAATWSAQGGGDLYDTFDLDLRNGQSLCHQLDPAAFGGYTDIRDLLEAVPWGLGYGELSALTADVQDVAAGLGEDWATEWEPNTMGAFLTLDRGTLHRGQRPRLRGELRRGDHRHAARQARRRAGRRLLRGDRPPEP
ncbi:MAG: hypothetical protein R3F59_28275 [Myxococcota bacterium]